MYDVPINNIWRREEEMQRVRRKDFKDEQWPKIQSPNNFVRRTVRRVFDVERPGCPGNKLVANSVTFYLESDKTLPQKERERKRDRLSQTRRTQTRQSRSLHTNTLDGNKKQTERLSEEERENIPFHLLHPSRDRT